MTPRHLRLPLILPVASAGACVGIARDVDVSYVVWTCVWVYEYVRACLLVPVAHTHKRKSTHPAYTHRFVILLQQVVDPSTDQVRSP